MNQIPSNVETVEEVKKCIKLNSGFTDEIQNIETFNFKAMNLESFKVSDKNIGAEMDFRSTEIIFIPVNNFTKANFKRFYSLLRSNYKEYKRYGNCGHEHDCCGCVCSEQNEITFSSKSTIVINTINLNY